MSAGRRIVALGLSLAVIMGACSSGSEDAARASTSAPTSTTTTTAKPTTTTTEATSTTVAETTTTTALSDGPATAPDVLASDGISTPEDASVFVVTSWIAGDRIAASRHADPGVLDALFAATPPAAETLEFIQCDTADLIRYDCFFNANGRIVIVGVERLRIIEASIDAD